MSKPENGRHIYAQYFMKNDITSNDSEYIFPGGSQKGYGTHSIRKGSATYASSGTTSYPTHASIRNQGGWSLGIQSRYLLHEKAEDCYIGRILSGLNVNDGNFTTLAPRFKKGYEEMVKKIMGEHFMKYEEIGEELQEVLRRTTASVIYYKEKIKREYKRKERLSIDDISNIL